MLKVTRRRFLKHLGVLTGTAVLAGGYTIFIEPYWVQVVKRPLPIQNLPKSLQGKTLLQISDIHVGNNFSWEYLIRELQQAQSLNADIVVYTGDFVSFEDEEQYAQLQEVIKHAPLGKLGTFGVTGNHDFGEHWADIGVSDQVCGIIEGHGIQMLRNEVTAVDGLKIGGIEDYWSPLFDPIPVTIQFAPDEPSLILCHNPDACDEPVWGEFNGWTLAGHTHGGQIRPPFFKAPVVPTKNRDYTSGEFDLGNGRKLYINRALGHYIPIRFNVRPEITLFTMVKEAS
ncbi:MAG: metallophosphoesterase [Chloroflexota bacterium]